MVSMLGLKYKHGTFSIHRHKDYTSVARGWGTIEAYEQGTGLGQGKCGFQHRGHKREKRREGAQKRKQNEKGRSSASGYAHQN